MPMSHMQCHGNRFTCTESDWTLRDGVNSLISSFSCTKQSNIFMQVPENGKMFVQVFRNNTVLVNQSVCQ